MKTAAGAVITAYDAREALIVVTARVEGPTADLEVRLVLDTGCGHCTLRPSVVRELGYREQHSLRPTSVRTALGVEQGFLLEVAALDALGHGFEHVPVNVFELAIGDDIDGLLGLSFLNQLNYEIRARDGVIVAERADTGS